MPDIQANVKIRIYLFGTKSIPPIENLLHLKILKIDKIKPLIIPKRTIETRA